MEKKINGQVPLSSLIFTLNWEDPESDVKALKMMPGQTLMTITSGGCNTLNFLLSSPKKIYAVDINPAQTWLMELKIAAIKNLDYDEFIGFLGLKKINNRIRHYEFLRKDLSGEGKDFWDRNHKLIENGILNNGRYERFIKVAGKILRIMQGSKKTKKLFQLNSIDEQKEFYNTQWNNKKWKYIFKLMFNKKRLAKKGLVAEYFHFDDGAQSFSESFYNRSKKVLCDIPIRNNYFLSLYLTGKYSNFNEMPLYLLKNNYDAIKRNIDKIVLITGDTKYYLETMGTETIDGFCLSNICELMSTEDTNKLFSEVFRTAKPGARVCFRNLMIPRDVPETLKQSIVKDELFSIDLLAKDRSFVYSKVAAYEIKK